MKRLLILIGVLATFITTAVAEQPGMNIYTITPSVEFEVDMTSAPEGTTVTITLSQVGMYLEADNQPIIPRVYYVSGEETVTVPSTKIGEGAYTFEMPAIGVMIEKCFPMAICELSANNETLTFKGVNRNDFTVPAGGTTTIVQFMDFYGGQTNQENDFTRICHNNVKKVIFDESVWMVNMIQTRSLFKDFSKLETIIGLGHLKMKRLYNLNGVSDLTEMFAGCSSLTSLTIDENFYVGPKPNEGIGTDIDDMFKGCDGLEKGTLTVNGTTAPTIEQDIFGVFREATMVVESQDLLTLLISDAGLSQYNDGSCDWKGGHFNKKYIGQIPQKSDINPTLSITGWTYGGQPSTPVLTGNEGNGEVTYQYKVKDSDDANYVTYNPAGETPSVPTEVGDYTLKAHIAETENYFEATVTANFTLSKAAITPTVTLQGWTYGDNANTPQISGNTGNGAVTYSYKVQGADDNTYTSDVPTTPGNYTVRATVAETGNYLGATTTADFTISKAAITPTVTLQGWTYGDNANTPQISGNTGSGAVTYSYKVQGANDNTYANDVPTTSGNYTVRATVAETDNYQGATVTSDFTIAKANATMTPPTAIENLVYTGQPQDLITAGSTTDGEMQYSLDGQTYDAAIPQGTDANTYTIYYKVVGDANHNDSQVATITSTISQPADGPYIILSDNNTTLTFMYGQKPAQGSVFVLSDDWNTRCKGNVTTVVFDPSFVDARPTSCYQWFNDFAELTTVTGMEYLNTSEATDMRYFFHNCPKVTSITIGSGFTVKSTTQTIGTYTDEFAEREYETMFRTFTNNQPDTKLDHGTLIVKGTPTIEKDIFANVFFYGVLTSDTELEGIGKNDNGRISWKGGGFEIYNDYYNIYPEYGFITDLGMAKAGTTVTISIAPGFDDMMPKVNYVVGEATATVPVTETEGGRTFEMPAAPVTITQSRMGAAVILSSDQKTLTIIGMESSASDIMQMTNGMRYNFFQEFQQGVDETDQRFEISQKEQYNAFVTACRTYVETVVIDKSIKYVSNIWSGDYLFYGFSLLTKVEGLENLNMQKFRSTAYMFSGCSSLTNLTIGSNFYIGAAGQGEQPGFKATDMFEGCTALANGTLTVTGTTPPIINQDIFSGVITNGILVTDPINLFDGSNEVSTQNGKTTYKGGVFSAFNQILYPITITQADHGTVTANNNAAEGETVILTITPDTDYELTGLTISYTDGDGQAQTIVATDGDNGTKTFIMPAYPVTITGTFSLVPSEVPYVMQSSDLTTLTFAYGMKPTGSTTWDLNGEWNNDNTKVNVTTVVFDETFATVKPTSTKGWFQGFNALATITNLTNLNTSEVTDMSYMFADCWVLRSVDLSNFNTTKVTDMSHMFETCTYLDNITIGANFTVGDANTTNTKDMFNGTSSMHSATLTVKGSSPSIGQDIFKEIIYAGQLMTENKFELDGVGTSASYFILYKGGLFMKYNDYNIIQPTNYYSVSPTKQIPNGEVIITSVPDENGRIYPPRVYYNNAEGRVNIDVTDLGGGKYSFTMPDSRVFIEAIIYTTLCQLSNDKETLTFWAVEQDEYQQIMQQQMQQQGQGGQQGQQGGQGQGEQSQQQTIMGYSQYISAQKNDNVTDFIRACHSQVKTVIFQQSVASALDTNGERLLYGFSALTAINGLENLNMKNFSSTKEMFAGCSSLSSLNIGSNFYIGADFEITDMFAGCTSLAGGTLTVTGSTPPVINQDIFSGVFTEGSLNDPDGLLGTEVTTDEDGTKHYKGGVFKTNIEQSENGEATTSSETVNGVKWALVYITPKENYELTSVKVVDKDGNDVSDEVELTDVSTPPYIIMKFKMPTYSVKVKLVFTLKPEAYHEQLTVGANKEWITYYADTYDLTLPQGLEAYYVSNVTLASDGKTGTVTLESTGNKLYKGVPALIRRTDNSTGDLNITATGARHNDGETVRNSMSANYLGTAVDMSLANQANSQVFVLRDGAFIKANTSTIAAHRCWIRLNATAASRLVLRSGGTTYIDDITTSEQKTEWYDLHGRKLDTKPVGKGVYIQNGKKIVVK